MRHEHYTSRLQIPLLPDPGASRTACPHVRVREVRVQPFPTASHRCLVRAAGAGGIQRHLQTANQPQAGARCPVVAGSVQRLPATIVAQPRHGIQELLSRSGEVSDLQEEECSPVGSLHYQRFFLPRRSDQAGQAQAAAEYPLEPSVHRHTFQRHGQQGQRGSLSHLDPHRGKRGGAAVHQSRGGDRPGPHSCGNHQSRREGQQSPIFSAVRAETGPCATPSVTQAEGQRQPGQGETEGRQNTRQNCRSAQRLCAQTFYPAHSREPSRSHGKFAGQEHAQEPLAGESHQQRGLASAHHHAGLQGGVVRAFVRADRQMVSLKQALPRLRSHFRRHAALSPFLGLPSLRHSARPRHQRCEQHSQGGQGHSGRCRQAARTSEHYYGGARRTLSLRSLCKTLRAIPRSNEQ